MAKSMFRMDSVFVSVAVRFHSFALSAVKVPLAQCSRASVLWSNSLSKPKANFLTKESTVSRGTTIFRREVIEQFHYKLLLCPKSAKAKAIVVEPVKQKTSESIVIWLQLISTRDFNREKLLHIKCSIAIWPISPNGLMNILYVSTFTQHLDSLPSHSIKLVFLYWSRCSAVITMTLLLLSLLVS